MAIQQIAFISLGPSCLSASLLRHAGLRTCSYPFDWGQTGGIHFKDALEMDPEEFYERHIVIPNLQLTQVSDPTNNKEKTAGLRQRDHIYGYPYYYNPHRPLGSDKDYYIRCLRRFKRVMKETRLMKVFLVTDYEDRPAEKYYDDPSRVADYIQDCLESEQGHDLYRLILVRISFNASILAEAHTIRLGRDSVMKKLYLPDKLQDSGSFERIAAKLVFKEYTGRKMMPFTP